LPEWNCPAKTTGTMVCAGVRKREPNKIAGLNY
jgi:hypothetical protein